MSSSRCLSALIWACTWPYVLIYTSQWKLCLVTPVVEPGTQCVCMWGHLGMFPVAQRQAAVLSKAVVAMDARRGSLKLNLSTLMKVFKWKWHFSSVMMKYNKIQAWFIVGCEISHGNFFVSQLVTTHSNCFIDYASRFLHALSLPSVYPPNLFPSFSSPLYFCMASLRLVSHILHFLYLYF